ncbi:MAG: hypothetical protein KDB14_10025 [Planctomycetales bacterium]|nr:hypothetical protein [Planctomycetales bacterium]
MTYGIREFASILEIRREERRSEKRRASASNHGNAIRDRSVPKRANGWKARWNRVRRAIEQLSELRSGFKEGQRHHAILAYATALKTLGYSDHQIAAWAEPIFAKMSQSPNRFSRNEFAAAIRSADCCRGDRFSSGLRYTTLIEWLQITPQEQEITGIVPRTKTPSCADKIKARRQKLAELQRQFPGASARRLAKMLGASAPTVTSDLRAIAGEAFLSQAPEAVS